jgi:phosphate transport system protein
MATHLQRELERLKKMVNALSTQVEHHLDLAVKSFHENDADLARKVIKDDRIIDDLEVELEEECLKALALYQPVAIDLRFIMALLKLNSDLERIGDLAADIAKNGIQINKSSKPKILLDLHDMTQLVKGIVRKSLDALVNIDTDLAREVISDDARINATKSEMKKSIISFLEKDPGHAEVFMTLVALISRLERIGDHACNIAEDVIYMAEAEIIRHQSTEPHL